MNQLIVDELLEALELNYEEMTSQERKEVRNLYVQAQGGECYFCGDRLDREPRQELQELPIDWSLFPSGFLDYPVHLQHNHSTKLCEGAVHSLCNAIMWNYWRR